MAGFASGFDGDESGLEMAHRFAEHERGKSMNAKLAPPPQITRETMLALLTATTEFAAVKPWEVMADCDLVGLIDPVTGETRLTSVLGNGGEVFGAVFYRRASGLRWILDALDSPEECMSLEVMEGMDCLKVELIPKRYMLREDLALLKALNFKPTGKGQAWPQFQSTTPGWMPWFIDQAESEQLLADIPRLTKFHALFRDHPKLFEDHLPGEIPFLPHPTPDRPLVLEDLVWRPYLSIPEPYEPFRATEQRLAQLRSLERVPTSSYEYGCKILSASSVLENGRPCYSRLSLLVEHRRGFVLGFELSLGPLPLSESAGQGLVNVLVKNGFLPGKILIDDSRLEPILQPLCDALKIKLLLACDLDALAEAMNSLNSHMQTVPR